VRAPQTVVAVFHAVRWGEWSPADPDGAFQPGKVRGILVGINAVKKSAVKMQLSGLAWVRF